MKFTNKADFLIQFKNFLLSIQKVEKKALLIIDEAQRLSSELLEEIRFLANIETDDHKIINIFFVGQSEFRSCLLQETNKAVRQRIAVRYHLDPLTELETKEYINHRLRIAGTKKKLFTELALRQTHHITNGYPRLINIVCDHALMSGYSTGKSMIDIDIINECERELELSNNVIKVAPRSTEHPETTLDLFKPGRPLFGYLAGIAAIAVLIFIAVFVYFYNSRNSDLAQNSGRIDMKQYPEIPVSEKEIESFKQDPIITRPSLFKNEMSTYGAQTDRLTERNTTAATENHLSNPQELGKEPEDKKIVAESLLIAPVNHGASIKKLSETPTEDVKKDQSIKETTLGMPVEEFNIYFEINSTDISSQGRETLNYIANYLSTTSYSTLQIEGFYDPDTEPEYGDQLSRLRANNVKSYIIGKGIPTEKINAVEKGTVSLIKTEAPPERKMQNPRVEILIGNN